jgi:hypothetical protein
VSASDSVKAGDVLIGDMRCYPELVLGQDGLYSPASPSADEVPGIHVMTDAGEMYAANESRAALDQDGVAVLPLEADQGTVAAYKRRCADLHAAGAPGPDIPGSVNPCLFVLDTLRAGCYMIMTASTDSVKKASAALDEAVQRTLCPRLKVFWMD